MKLNLFLLIIVLLGTFLTAEAKGKQRDWQTGKVLGLAQEYRFVGSEKSGTKTYTVEIGNYVYVGLELSGWSKPAHLTVNGPVKVAIEKNKMYLVGDDGIEHEATILKKTLKKTPDK